MAFSANDLMALVHAGFSARQIEMIGRELSTESPAPSTESTVPTQSAVPTQSTESTAQSTESTVPTPSTDSTESIGAAAVEALAEHATPRTPSMGDIMAKLDALTRAVNAGAIRNDQQPGAASPRDSAADIMAQIINPTYKKEE